MSACDTCKQPGACCTRMHLRSEGDSDVALSFWADDLPMLRGLIRMAEWGLPFIPYAVAQEFSDKDGRKYQRLQYRCVDLGSDGRCMNYEHRPQLCRDYEPLSDPLCVMYEPPA